MICPIVKGKSENHGVVKMGEKKEGKGVVHTTHPRTKLSQENVWAGNTAMKCPVIKGKSENHGVVKMGEKKEGKGVVHATHPRILQIYFIGISKVPI